MGYIIVGTIIGGIIWGIVVNKVIENKGYEENWFWWGFFFGIFALIIALTKQSVNTTKVVIESSVPIKENMELLSSCILNNRVNVSSSIHIASWEIKKDAEKVVLFVDFINVSNKEISAVMFSATGFNAFGDRVEINGADLFDVIGQDLSIKPNECGKVYATLQDDAIRKVEVKVKKICFADGTIADDIPDEWINTNQSELQSIHIDCAKRENAQSKYYSIIKEHYWQCVCGFVNPQNTCAICGMQKNNALKFAQKNIEATYNRYLTELETEKQKKEEERIENERRAEIKREKIKQRNKIIKKYTIIITSLIVICIAIILLLNYVILPNNKYNKAIELMQNQKYEESIKIFTELEDYKDSIKQISSCETAIKETKYNNAIELMKNQKYEESIKIFTELEDYKDSIKQISNCETAIKEIKYKNATVFLNNNQYDEAISIFKTILDYKDSKELHNKAIKQKYSTAVTSLNNGRLVDVFKQLFNIASDEETRIIFSDHESSCFETSDWYEDCRLYGLNGRINTNYKNNKVTYLNWESVPANRTQYLNLLNTISGVLGKPTYTGTNRYGYDDYLFWEGAQWNNIYLAYTNSRDGVTTYIELWISDKKNTLF